MTEAKRVISQRGPGDRKVGQLGERVWTTSALPTAVGAKTFSGSGLAGQISKYWRSTLPG